MSVQKGKDLLLRLANEAGQFIAVAGVRRASVSGAGVFRDEAADAAVRAMFFDDVIGAWQIAIPDFGLVEGPFQIASLEYRGEHDGEVTFEIALESAGALTFEAM
jgi:TP901-1 family phage major tail protein